MGKNSMKSRLLGLLAVVTILVAPRMAVGEPLKLKGSCDPKDAKDCVQPLLEGEQAPFTGQLLSTRRAIRLFQKADSCQERMDLAVQETTERLTIDVELGKRLREIDLAAHKAQVDLLTERLEEAKARPWYESSLFVATVSVVLTGVVFYGAIQAVDAATK